MLLRQQFHLSGHKVSGILRTLDLGTFLRGQRCDTPPKFQRCHDLASLGVAQPPLASEFGVTGASQTAQPFDIGQDTRRDIDGVLAGNAGSQQDSHQLGIIQITRPMRPQPFSGSLAGGQLTYGGLVRNRCREDRILRERPTLKSWMVSSAPIRFQWTKRYRSSRRFLNDFLLVRRGIPPAPPASVGDPAMTIVHSQS